MKDPSRQAAVKKLASLGRRLSVLLMSKGWTVYMLRCADGSLYTGATNDLSRRVRLHQEGKGASYTRSHRPLTLVFSEAVADRSAAYRREAALKRLCREEKLRLLNSQSRP